MKDYRQIKKMEPGEWENNIDWMACRLDFLWCIEHYKPELYRKLKLSEEKNDFYEINNNEVGRLAQEKHYSVNVDYYKKYFSNIGLVAQHSLYKKLNNMRQNNLKEFLLKKNCNMYDYLREQQIANYLMK